MGRNISQKYLFCDVRKGELVIRGLLLCGDLNDLADAKKLIANGWDLFCHGQDGK